MHFTNGGVHSSFIHPSLFSIPFFHSFQHISLVCNWNASSYTWEDGLWMYLNWGGLKLKSENDPFLIIEKLLYFSLVAWGVIWQSSYSNRLDYFVNGLTLATLQRESFGMFNELDSIRFTFRADHSLAQKYYTNSHGVTPISHCRTKSFWFVSFPFLLTFWGWGWGPPYPSTETSSHGCNTGIWRYEEYFLSRPLPEWVTGDFPEVLQPPLTHTYPKVQIPFQGGF